MPRHQHALPGSQPGVDPLSPAEQLPLEGGDLGAAAVRVPRQGFDLLRDRLDVRLEVENSRLHREKSSEKGGELSKSCAIAVRG